MTVGGERIEATNGRPVRTATRLLSASACVALVAVPVAFAPWLYDDFTLVKQSLLLVAGALLLTALALRGRLPPLSRLEGGLLAVWALGLFLSTVAALDWRGSLLGLYQYRQGALTQVVFVLLFLAARALAQEGAHRAPLRAGMAGLAGAATYAGLQAFDADPFGWWLDTGDRAIGTIGNANELAAYGVIGLALASVWAGRGSAFAAAFVAAAGVFLVTNAASRAGTLALGIAFVALVALTLWQRTGPRQAATMLAPWAAGLALGFGLSLLSGGVGRSEARVDGGGTPSDQAASATRIAYWEGAVHSIAASPFLGAGADGLALAFPRHRPGDLGGGFRSDDLIVKSAHSWPLDLAANFGIPAAVSVLGFVGVVLARGLDAARRGAAPEIVPVVAACVGYLALTCLDPISLAPHALFWFVLGTLPATATTVALRWRPRWAIAVAAPVAAAACVLAVGLPVADSFADDGWDQYAAGDFAAAGRAYDRAWRLMPFEPDYQRRAGLAWLADGAVSGSRDSLLRAEEGFTSLEDHFEPTTGSSFALATTLIGRGAPASEIDAAVARGERLDPKSEAVAAYAEALRAGGVLRYSEIDRWVFVEPR
ncbi:MAG: O-antigen ligase family protein [Dehalococcoidia bacterium]